eukprot:TRINITY_DN20170_c0_g1_i1.p1 TRINITY_DN20170_c0_g1~~TRINITY_DN20170_c0_g1_i1.p1  ORF type:complete len:110 (+),score=10.05 TRINITY_DN20170_c0_g1_i1:3-332(+)
MFKRELVTSEHFPTGSNAAKYFLQLLDEWRTNELDYDKVSRLLMGSPCLYIPPRGYTDGIYLIPSPDKQAHVRTSGHVILLPEQFSFEEFKAAMEDMIKTPNIWMKQCV